MAESAASRDVFVVVVSGRSEREEEGCEVAVGGFLGFTAEVGVELVELRGGQQAAFKGARGSYVNSTTGQGASLGCGRRIM